MTESEIHRLGECLVALGNQFLAQQGPDMTGAGIPTILMQNVERHIGGGKWVLGETWNDLLRACEAHILYHESKIAPVVFKAEAWDDLKDAVARAKQGRAEVVWTKTPTADGFYWLDDGLADSVVKVTYLPDDKGTVTFCGNEAQFPMSAVAGAEYRWFGPLAVPPD